jgi:hypothetical protein
MWSISSKDVEYAKERIRLRRSEIEARYAEELKALDAELEAVSRLERAAAEFASHSTPAEVAPARTLEAPVETAPGNDGEAPDSGPAERRESGAAAGSRWRLHLGSRPADTEGGGSLASAQR